ncbi:hypothetical protein SK3146_06492 [Paenibacillus konkukensis]|uniref:Uncharacterized protein n=1 Tax=Paenibacillus konkukensis TaxID=2020716 RepID=A0ABY4RXS4_9BACL|nr:hypothetical protein [Paenibacillus konkukensis]UQZ87195.1 hypothetical protein SK3146_06492 [Paenibacillus konkukensis]
MYQSYQQNSFQPQMGAGNVMSQYRGLETKYQPIGFVQSQYNQSLNSGMGGQFQNQQHQNQAQFSSFQSQSPQSYHTASYRGNQQGHDAYLRSDSAQPAQSQFGGSYMNQAPSYSSFNSFSGQQQFNQQQHPESYHTASYRGNQQGHDAYLRSDSSQPAQNQYGIGASAMHSYNTGMNSNSFASSQQFNQFQAPQSYHTANYRGDQQGHDAYLRSDSAQPAQSQFGSSGMNINRYQF